MRQVTVQTIKPYKLVRLSAPNVIRLYASAYNYAEPDTVEALYDLSEEICDVSSEVADQLQRNAIGVE